MTHKELCERAETWLSSIGCNVVLSGIASTSEIPDAIGWASGGRLGHYGSIVVECKTSVEDFRRDKAKGHAITIGRQRYFLVHGDWLTAEMVKQHYPDHGLAIVQGRRVAVPWPAQRRETCDLDSEIRLLRFALVHIKDNLLSHGCTVDLCELTKFHGRHGLKLPQQESKEEFKLQTLDGTV